MAGVDPDHHKGGPAGGGGAEADASSPRSVALVLGAGGVTGWAWLVGALAALERHSGWDPRRAGVIVGTSAGSGVAAMLRAGLSAADQYAQYVDQPVSAAGQAVLDRLDAPSNASGPAARGGEAARSGDRTPLNPLLAVRGMLRWPPRPGLALAGLAPRGGKPLGSLPHRLRAAHATWPAEALWITSVRVSDGRRMVFGRDPSRVDVGTAVEASCAVPGFFQPVEVDGADHVDGGAWSATNADLTAGLGFETVVVIAPLSADRDALGWSLGHARRAYHRANLSREAGIASDAGSEVHRIEPGRADLAVLTGNELDGARRREIAEQGFASMRSRLDAGSPLAGALG